MKERAPTRRRKEDRKRATTNQLKGFAFFPFLSRRVWRFVFLFAMGREKQVRKKLSPLLWLLTLGEKKNENENGGGGRKTKSTLSFFPLFSKF